MNHKQKLINELRELIDGYLFLTGADDPLTDSEFERISAIINRSL